MEHGPSPQPDESAELAPVIDLGEVQEKRGAQLLNRERIDESPKARLDRLLAEHPEIPRDESGMPTLDRWPVSADVFQEVTAAEDAYKAWLEQSGTDASAA